MVQISSEMVAKSLPQDSYREKVKSHSTFMNNLHEYEYTWKKLVSKSQDEMSLKEFTLWRRHARREHCFYSFCAPNRDQLQKGEVMEKKRKNK